MPRLIDADEAYKVLTDYYHQRTEIQRKALKEAFSRVPTVDAVEVVRCKDCKYFNWWVSQGKEEFDCHQFLEVPPITPDWYCAWGERREDAETKADRNGFIKQDDLFPQGR